MIFTEKAKKNGIFGKKSHRRKKALAPILNHLMKKQDFGRGHDY